MIEITDNIDAAQRGLSDFALRQLPFATAMALNDAAMDAKQAEEREIETVFDAPTPFTKKGLFVSRARKTKLEAVVGFKDRQADYLRLQRTGGVRRPKGRALVVPVNQRRNKYGNLPRNTTSRLKSKKGVFSTKQGDRRSKHLPAGVYQRPSKAAARRGSGPKLLIAFEPKTQYRRRLDFTPVVERAVRRSFPDSFQRRLRQAIKTAR